MSTPRVGAVTLALLFGLYSMIYGVYLIVLGIHGRTAAKTLDSAMAPLLPTPRARAVFGTGRYHQSFGVKTRFAERIVASPSRAAKPGRGPAAMLGASSPLMSAGAPGMP